MLRNSDTWVSGSDSDAKQGRRKEACFLNLGGASPIVWWYQYLQICWYLRHKPLHIFVLDFLYYDLSFFDLGVLPSFSLYIAVDEIVFLWFWGKAMFPDMVIQFMYVLGSLNQWSEWPPLSCFVLQGEREFYISHMNVKLHKFSTFKLHTVRMIHSD